MNYSEDLLGIAGRVIWFESPDDALRYPNRFLAHLMTLRHLGRDRNCKKNIFPERNSKQRCLILFPGFSILIPGTTGTSSTTTFPFRRCLNGNWDKGRILVKRQDVRCKGLQLWWHSSLEEKHVECAKAANATPT